jgi:FkbM family methyltransferase
MNELIEFCTDTENGEKNYSLAKWYESQGHTAPAHTYYLRAAERSENPILSYQSLIRASFCYKSQGSRDTTEKILLENALNLIPNRPEAYYFLCLLYERKQDWQNCYTFANLGLQFSDNTQEKLDIPEYPGKYILIFQKAVSSWWWGKGQESRNLLWSLVDNYWEDMPVNIKLSVEHNISRIGSGPNSQNAVFYSKNKYQNLRHKFKGCEKIERSHSQAFQDMFVLTMLDGKREGTFLEIGASTPFERNNTALLETDFNWKGTSIEIDNKFESAYRELRPNVNFICENALKINYDDLLDKNYQSNIIDYLQLDIEPARNTYECMLKIPFDRYKFAVITYEHDDYIDITKSCKDKSREFLKSKGYVLVVNDVSVDGISTFEDWWVHPDLVDENMIKIMRSEFNEITNIEEYFYSKKYYAEFDTDKYIREKYFSDFSYKGVMVEVGAGPPEFISNSKHFRDSGWRTICVEANPKFVEQHKNAGSEVYHYACSDKEEDTEFIINYNNDNWYSQENDGVSFSSLDIRYKNVPNHNTQEKIKVSTIRLNTLLEKVNADKVDVLSIDTEGWELDVMNGFDHIKYSPKVIVLENFESNPEYEKFMNQRGYKKDISLGYNEIYLNTTTQQEYTPKFTTHKGTCWIVDNFYADPDEVRNFALEVPYFEGGIGRGFIGRRSQEQYLFPGLKEKFEKIMGKKITGWEGYDMNGRFQAAWSGEPLVYHCDSQQWGGMLYLTPEPPYQCGTTLYAHKKTRARTYYDQGWDAAWTNIPGDCHLDGTPFEPVDVLGNVYNRLVIFDASCIHSASEYFGTVMENARLWQMFFFDAE